VQLAEALIRLAHLPDPLPQPPVELMPAVLTGPPRPTIRLDQLASRLAAVLVLLVGGPDGEALVVLTERVIGGRHHSGEVSFPGGSADPGDADPVATALREATEEIGLDVDAAQVTVLGTLEPVWIPVSGFRLTPVVAVCGRYPVLNAAPAEVSRIVMAPLAGFLPGAEIRIVQAEIADRRLRYGAYPVGDLLVWGATARVLGQLGAILGGVR
jgi:8-oxo-dGTP pyrophosphatase MutT (NUDIX family)